MCAWSMGGILASYLSTLLKVFVWSGRSLLPRTSFVVAHEKGRRIINMVRRKQAKTAGLRARTCMGDKCALNVVRAHILLPLSLFNDRSRFKKE
jgi:hypothetical protein